jgi:hypothetical protein
MDSEENIDEFLTIIQLLNDCDLGVLHEVLMMETETEQIKCLRALRFVITNYPQTYNAYTARVLVINPIEYITNEILSRYKKTFLIY